MKPGTGEARASDRTPAIVCRAVHRGSRECGGAPREDTDTRRELDDDIPF